MDFFQQQDAARHKTGWLVFLFALAVVAIILTIYFLVFAAVGAGREYFVQETPTASRSAEPREPNQHGGRRGHRFASEPARGATSGAGTRSGLSALWDPEIFLFVSLGTLSVIALGSLLKIAELSAGGDRVALMLGGRLISPGTQDLAERRLLNVVEEMALASGVPVPPVYVLDRERSINAFAAGHSPDNAVVAVSRGALEYLKRDELQGVMGHEFSHILNGDMRLNLRLIGLLNGILILAILGYYAMRIAGTSSNSSSNSGNGRGRLAAFLIGLALLIIGYVGVFFGKLIKAAVSRQREYLADASAVQFTRYPAGISGALKKIGGLAQGSRIRDAHAEECSHLFFGDAFAGSLFNLFATHPPLPDRIRRIDPTFDGTFPKTVPVPEDDDSSAQPEVPRLEPAASRPAREGRGEAKGVAATAAGLAGRIGTVAPEQLLYAAALIGQTPPRLTGAASEPFGARAVVYAVLLDTEDEVRRAQLAALQGAGDESCYRETLALLPLVDQLSEEAQIPLVERACPALKQISPGQYDAFRKNVEALIKADARVTLLEYAIQAMLFRTLDVHFGRAKPPRIRYYAIRGVMEPLTTVLSTLAYAGQTGEDAVRKAFEAGVKEIDCQGSLAAKGDCSLAAFDAALRELAMAAPKVKGPVLAACAACVTADGTVTVREGELLRAISSTLGCPMPPIRGQGLGDRG